MTQTGGYSTRASTFAQFWPQRYKKDLTYANLLGFFYEKWKDGGENDKKREKYSVHTRVRYNFMNRGGLNKNQENIGKSD